MADADRPGSADTAPPRLRAVRGGAVRRRSGLPTPADFAHRLSALEQQVESALAGTGDSVFPDVGEVADDLLSAYASAWRWAEETGEQLRTPRGAVDLWLTAVYRWWWRVEAFGLERIPSSGPVVVVVNRAGTVLPYDAVMVAVALRHEHPAQRVARPLVDDWIMSAPGVSVLANAVGAVPATVAALRRTLDAGEIAVIMPDGREACARSYDRRYRVGAFSRTAVLRAAVAAGASIIPVAVIGAEESQPVWWRFEALGRAFGVPAVPITTTFPWLGLPGLVPLPTKWSLHAGESLETARYGAGAARTPAVVRTVRDQIRERLQALVTEGVRRRRSIFFG